MIESFVIPVEQEDRHVSFPQGFQKWDLLDLRAQGDDSSSSAVQAVEFLHGSVSGDPFHGDIEVAQIERGKERAVLRGGVMIQNDFQGSDFFPDQILIGNIGSASLSGICVAAAPQMFDGMFHNGAGAMESQTQLISGREFASRRKFSVEDLPDQIGFDLSCFCQFCFSF